MSCFSSHNVLSGFGEYLASPLISEAAGRALRAISERLPAVGSVQYLETRLGSEPPARVDFLLAISRLQRELVKHYTDTYRKLGPGVSPLCRALERWTDRESSLYEALPLLWLEFDDVERQGVLSANLCATVAPSYLDPFSPVVSLARGDLPAILFEILSVARGSCSSPAEREGLTRCVRVLPAGAHWLHLSVMTARAPQMIKLYGVFPRGTVAPYLRELGWAGDVPGIERLLARYAGLGDELYIDLCVSELLCEGAFSLGLCFPKQQINPADPCRTALLELLLADGLCSQREANALAQWPRSVALGIGPESRLVLERWFEIKLVHRSPGPMLAKAYLGFAVGSPCERRATTSQAVRYQGRA